MSTGNSRNTQNVDLPFDGGMDQRTHPRRTNAPTVLEAVNVRYPQLGGVEKRPGLRSLGSTFKSGWTLQPAQGKLIGFQNELLVADKFRLGSRTIAGNAEQFIDKGQTPEATSKLKPVDSTQYQVIGQDIGYSTDGLLFHTWLGGGAGANSILGSTPNNGVFATVEDVATGTLLSSSFQFTDHSIGWWPPRVVVAGAEAYVMWTETLVGAPAGGVTMHYSHWDRATMTWGAVNNLVVGIAEFAVCSDGTFVYVLAATVASGLQVFKYSVSASPTLTLVNTATIVPSASAAGISVGLGIDASGGQIWGAFSRNATPVTVSAFTLNPTTGNLATGPFVVYTSTLLSFAFQCAPVCVAGTRGVIAIQEAGFAVFPCFNSNGTVFGNATAANRTTYWSFIASKPFVVTTDPLRCYIFMNTGGAGANGIPGYPDGSPSNATPQTYTHMLVDLVVDVAVAPVAWAPRPITWQAPRFTASLGVGSFAFPLWPTCSVAKLSNGNVVTDLTIIRSNAGRLSLAQHIVDFSGKDRLQSCQIGQTLVVSPGFFYDKAVLAELSFAYYPWQFSAKIAAIGGTLAADTYTYKAVYEFVDANGFVHQSNASDAIEVVVSSGTTNTITLRVPCLDITARQGPGAFDSGVRIAMYRQTLSHGTGRYVRLYAAGADYLNDSTKQYIDIVDSSSANGDEGNPELALDTGVFPNVMPSAFTSCVTYRNRVWIAYGHTVNYSKAFVTGETVNFTDAFELPLEETGDITAMWVMDDTLFISTAERIYYMYADGPNDFGQQSDVNTPNRVATDFGVIDQRSVVVTQIGTLYQSRAGIQLLDRSRAVSQEPIGSRVQKDLSQFSEIVSATLHPGGRTVAFACHDPNGLSIRLIYDYSTDRWSRDTLLLNSDSVGSRILSEAVAGFAKYTLVGDVNVASVIYAEDATTNLDAGAWVPMVINMGEVHPLGLQSNISFVKWTVMQDRQTAYNMSAGWYKDYEAAAFQTSAFSDAQITAMPQPQFSFDTSIHRAQSMRIRVADQQPSGTIGTGKGAVWIGLAVELDPLDNKTFKLASSQKA